MMHFDRSARADGTGKITYVFHISCSVIMRALERNQSLAL